jgi:hypothetical protein
MINELKKNLKKLYDNLNDAFIITEDGTPQTDLRNKGRFGLYIEKSLGVLPNKSREPDFGEWELKTVNVKTPAVSIGTIPRTEFNSIKNSSEHFFEMSNPYQKMRKTIFVYYQKISSDPSPEYKLHGWKDFKLNDNHDDIKRILDEDYTRACEFIKQSHDYQSLTQAVTNKGVRGTYLSLTYKGDKTHVYPSWKFTTKFMRTLMKNSQ